MQNFFKILAYKFV